MADDDDGDDDDGRYLGGRRGMCMFQQMCRVMSHNTEMLKGRRGMDRKEKSVPGRWWNLPNISNQAQSSLFIVGKRKEEQKI